MVGSSLKKDNLSTQSPLTSSLHLGCHFLHLLTPPRFGALNRESESSGSQPVYRKLFPHGPHSSKNIFFEIRISRPTPLDSLSVLLWLLVRDIFEFFDLFLFYYLARNVDGKSILQKTLKQFGLVTSKYERKSRYKSNFQCVSLRRRVLLCRAICFSKVRFSLAFTVETLSFPPEI